jgi:hypothetical protein
MGTSLLYCHKSTFFTAAQATEAFKTGGYRRAGTLISTKETVEAAIEDAIARSQNIDHSWNAPQRSTSVGDILKCGDALYIVAPLGIDRL